MHSPFFFLHIPKTAGTTLNHIFAANFGADKILSAYSKEETNALWEMDIKDIYNYDLVQGHLFISDFNSLFSSPLGANVFTFLREPAARVVSEYKFLKNWPQQHLYKYINENNIQFSDFITSTHPLLINHGKNLMTRSLCGVGCSGPEEMLERAKKHLLRFIFVGITERFDEGLLILEDKMRLKDIHYAKSNVSPFQHTLTEEEMSLIHEYNQQDMELYKYACTLFEKQVQQAGEDFQHRLKVFHTVQSRYHQLLEQKKDHTSPGGIGYSKD